MMRVAAALSVVVLALACKTSEPAKPPQREAQTTPQVVSGKTPDRSGSAMAAGEGGVDLRPIGFEFDASTLDADATARLSKIAEHMRAKPGTRLKIVGHTDERGTSEYNLSLGDARARAALDYLVRLGIEKKRITVVSRGEEEPRARGSSEEAWRENRRDEFELSSAPDA